MEADNMGDRSDAESGAGSGSGSGSDSGSDSCESSGSGSTDAGPAQLFDQIMHECRHNSPGQCFSKGVRDQIERLRGARRAALVRRTRHGAAPLFAACARGNVPLAEYLVQVCGAALEQRGAYRAGAAPEQRGPHRVTPLWAAAVAGRLDVLRALLAWGADVDAGSDSGSTPLRSACFMSHVEVARLLIARGADVARPNHSGGTCLVNAVQCVPLCRLLLQAGARVDAQDAQLKTALHYAIQERREDAARLLLEAGADPALATRAGDDALQLACIKGAASLVAQLVRAVGYSAARVADAYELLGATQLDEYNNAGAALHSWRAATAFRHQREGAVIGKRPRRAPAAALGGAREWTAQAELDAHAHDVDWLRTQALLVAVRVLSPHHKDTLFRLMYRGAAYADAFRYARCVALWTWVLELRIQKDTLLHPECSQTLVALTRLLQQAAAGGAGDGLSAPHAALAALRLLTQALPECQRLLAVRPACRAQGAAFDRALRCAAHLALTALAHGAHLDAALRREVSALVALEPRAVATGDTLLHLACSRLNVVHSTYFANEITQTESAFPSAALAQLLLQCGAAVSRRNRARCTPLHVAAIPYNFSTELVETLVAWGAHLDQPNRYGDSPAELVQQNPASRVRPLRHVTLACRAARALLAHYPRKDHKLPATLRPFLELHRA